MFNELENKPKSEDQLDQSNKQTSRPVPDEQVDDIFAETDQVSEDRHTEVHDDIPVNTESSKVPAETSSVSEQEKVIEGIEEDKKGGSRSKSLIYVIIILMAIAVSAYFVYNRLYSSPVEFVEEDLQQEMEDLVEEASKVEEAQIEDIVVPPIEPPVKEEESAEEEEAVIEIVVKDSDNDLLNDEEEKILGTDLDNPDTDGDGLSDWDEVQVYRTNPLNSDTDGDGYSDGDEVENGYNPAGPGELIE